MRKLSMRELNRVTPKVFKTQPKTPIVLILDNVRSALNVGSAFRTADAFALQHIYLCGITAKPPHREILKTAIGATASVDWTYCKTTIEAIEAIKQQGFKVYGIEQTDEKIWLQDFKVQVDERYAFVFGNEVKGIANEVLPHLEGCIEVPQFGTKHSLNISVCVGVVVWAIFQKMLHNNQV